MPMDTVSPLYDLQESKLFRSSIQESQLFNKATAHLGVSYPKKFCTPKNGWGYPTKSVLYPKKMIENGCPQHPSRRRGTVSPQVAPISLSIARASLDSWRHQRKTSSCGGSELEMRLGVPRHGYTTESTCEEDASIPHSHPSHNCSIRTLWLSPHCADDWANSTRSSRHD